MSNALVQFRILPGIFALEYSNLQALLKVDRKEVRSASRFHTYNETHAVIEMNMAISY